jgi:hypothetical protein
LCPLINRASKSPCGKIKQSAVKHFSTSSILIVE